MKRALAMIMIILGLLVVAGCEDYDDAEPKNTDPRKGRVNGYVTDCGWDSCRQDFKVCIGPDLLVHVVGVKPDARFKDSDECKP